MTLRIESSELGTGLSGLADPRIASVVPDPRLGSGAVDSRAGAGVSDHRLVALTVQLSQLQPRLDDLYTRVMPSLDEIKIKMKKAEEKGKLSAQEDTEHIQKILDIVEDLREEKRYVFYQRGGGLVPSKMSAHSVQPFCRLKGTYIRMSYFII